MTVRYIGKWGSILAVTVPLAVLAIMAPRAGRAAEGDGLWPVYEQSLEGAKYVDLTHTITPKIPVWSGFAASTFAPAKAGSDIEGYVKTGEVYTYEKHGFEATQSSVSRDLRELGVAKAGDRYILPADGAGEAFEERRA